MRKSRLGRRGQPFWLVVRSLRMRRKKCWLQGSPRQVELGVGPEQVEPNTGAKEVAPDIGEQAASPKDIARD